MALTLRLSDSLTLRVDDDTAAALATQLGAAGFGLDTETSATGVGDEAFSDDHVIWSRHTGGSGHFAEPEWTAADGQEAESFYAAVQGKARVFFDLLIDRPGQRLSTDDIRRLAPGVFGNDHSIAGSVNGLSKAKDASGRRYPFYWWQERPTRYAMKPSVAELFANARSLLGG